MATAHEAVDARQKAVEELARLLQDPDDLERLLSLRGEYKAKRQTTSAHLSAALASQVDATCSGLEALEAGHQSLRRLQQTFVQIKSLCGDCESLVDAPKFAKIRRLSATHFNLAKTLCDVEAVAALPQEAGEAEELLRDGGGGGGALVAAYVRLAMLEGTSAKARRALEGAGAGARDTHNLGTYFTQVQRSMGQLEERLWSRVRNYRALARADPAALVAALQVVEMQEALDAELLPAGQGACMVRKRWKYRCFEQIAASVQESFAPLLQRCSQLLAHADAHAALAALLRDASALAEQLGEAPRRVAPCFPPHYRVVAFLCGEHRRHTGSMVRLVGLCAPQLSNADILAALAWVQDYRGRVEALGPGPDGGAFDDGGGGSGGGVAALLDTYMQRVGATLDGWLRNIVEADATSEPLSTGEGRMWTPGAVDLFRILDEQVSVVTATRAGGALLLRVGDEAVRVMRAFQRGCRARLGALPLEHLCAVANNSLRCHHLGEEFAARLNATCLSQGVDGQVDVLEACQAFVELSQEAAAACVGIVFSDPGLVELVGRVACTEQWATGVATSSVLATLEDFLQDFRRWLEPPPFQHAVDLMRAEAAAHFLAALTTQLRAVREDSLRAVRQDAAKLAAFFAPFSSSSAAARACQPLVSAAEFLAADSVEAFVLGYTALLESAPGITPTLLANLLAARVAGDSGMTKADSKEILEACRGVYSSWTSAAAEEAGAGVAPRPSTSSARPRGGASGREATFNAALNAARKRPPAPAE